MAHLILIFIAESVPNHLQDSARKPKPVQPLPKEEDQEEKARLIAQILELQNTLEGWIYHILL